MGMTFSRAGTSDALVLNCLSKQAFDSDTGAGAPTAGGPPGYMSLKFHMKMARTKHLFKLTDQDLIVGGAILFLQGDRLQIGRIFVSPEHHRRGCGTFMMREAEAAFPDAKTFTLETPVWNARTNAFYKKLGYTEIRRDESFVYYMKHRE